MTQMSNMMYEINHAIANKIIKFEFTGDYNWKHATGYADVARSKVFCLFVHNVIKQYIKEHPNATQKMIYNDGLRAKDYIKITSKTLPDRKHMYCELKLDDLKEKIISIYF